MNPEFSFTLLNNRALAQTLVIFKNDNFNFHIHG